MGDYYPAWKARLILRIDEMGDTKSLDDKLPSKTKLKTQVKGTGDTSDNLDVVTDPDSPPGVTRYLLQPKAPKASGGQQSCVTSSDDRTFEIEVMPRKVSWKVESAREAETLKVDLQFVDLPLDPRVIRSCGIKFYLGTITPEEFAQAQSTGKGLPLLPDSHTWPDGVTRESIRFSGWVDEWNVEWAEDEPPMVSLECRDNTKLMISQESAPQLTIGQKEPIDKAIAKYLSNYPQFAGLSVEYRPNTDTPPKLESILSPTAFKPKLGVSPSKGGDAKLSVWDFLTDIVGSIGHLIRVEGNVIVVQRVRTFTTRAYIPRSDDPYQQRTVDGLALPRRAMIYGQNLQSLKIARKYSKGIPTNVEVRCYNPARKNTIVARWPNKGESIANPVNPGDGAGDHSVHVVRMTGVIDAATLKTIAQSTYEVLGRTEMSLHLKTKALSSFGGGNADPDLFYLLPGDGVDLMVAHGGVDLPYANSEQSARALLESAGFSGKFVDVYTKAYGSQGFQSTFISRGIQVDCDSSEGVSIDIELVNYLEIRVDKDPNG